MAIWRGTTTAPGVVFLLQLRHAHAELLGDRALNGLDGHLAHLQIDKLLEALLRRPQA